LAVDPPEVYEQAEAHAVSRGLLVEALELAVSIAEKASTQYAPAAFCTQSDAMVFSSVAVSAADGTLAPPRRRRPLLPKAAAHSVLAAVVM
jgi:hypothetical protein